MGASKYGSSELIPERSQCLTNEIVLLIAGKAEAIVNGESDIVDQNS